MSEYQIAVKQPKQPRPAHNLCGDCGAPVSRNELLCKECIEDAKHGFVVLGAKFPRLRGGNG